MRAHDVDPATTRRRYVLCIAVVTLLVAIFAAVSAPPSSPDVDVEPPIEEAEEGPSQPQPVGAPPPGQVGLTAASVIDPPPDAPQPTSDDGDGEESTTTEVGAAAPIEQNSRDWTPISTQPTDRWYFGENDGDVEAQTITIRGNSFVRPPNARSPPVVPMPGAVDHTVYVNNFTVGTTLLVPKETPNRGRQLRMINGILASPQTLQKRVFPQLLTSLRDEESVVFIERNDSRPEQREAVTMALDFLREHPTINATAILLEPIEDMTSSIRNAWMDLPVLDYLWDHFPGRDWYNILDDDTYAFMANVRMILGLYPASERVIIAETLRWGEQGGMRLIRGKGGRKVFVPSTRRIPHTFPCGGSGIYISRAATETLRGVTEKCIPRHLHPAGDVRLGACIVSDAPSVTLIRRREFVKDMVLRAVGELELPHYFALPAAFHRSRWPSMFERLHHVESQRGRWGIVSWDDLLAVFPPETGGGFSRFDYFPNSYNNCSDEFGARPPQKVYSHKIRWGRNGLPPKPTPRPDALPGEWAGCDRLVGKNLW